MSSRNEQHRGKNELDNIMKRVIQVDSSNSDLDDLDMLEIKPPSEHFKELI